jgi:hypothetical protein
VPELLQTRPFITPIVSALSAQPSASQDGLHDERCGAQLYRMPAVWHPACRFKTDCCGW